MLPNASGQFHLVDGWAHGGGAQSMPDYYHQFGTDGGDLPQTPLAKVSAFKGRAIAGFVAYTDDQNPRHEYVVGRFSSPLKWVSAIKCILPSPRAACTIGSMRVWG